MLELFSYFRSSAAYRVRIALGLKGLAHTLVPVHLLQDGGQQHAPAYRALNPEGLLPSLRATEDSGASTVLSQSLAIIEYLEECYPEPPLLPRAPLDRAWVRALALAVACDIHPLNNLRVLQHLEKTFLASSEQRDDWYRHWIVTGFASLEARLAHRQPQPFCAGDKPGLAEVCLIPQISNAHRYRVDMTAFPRLAALYEHCMSLPVFQMAAPEAQPDFPHRRAPAESTPAQ